MDQQKVAMYFGVLTQVVNDNDLINFPGRIWKMDETGIQQEHNPGKNAARKGTKYIHASGNRETITVIAAVSEKSLCTTTLHHQGQNQEVPLKFADRRCP